MDQKLQTIQVRYFSTRDTCRRIQP